MCRAALKKLEVKNTIDYYRRTYANRRILRTVATCHKCVAEFGNEHFK